MKCIVIATIMPVCCDCSQERPKASFAKSQLKKKPDARRCKACAEPMGGPRHPCWICLDADSDEHGTPRRDCSCRGTAGYVHVSCLIDMAGKKSDAIDLSKWNEHTTLGVSVGGTEINPWRECITCRQVYTGPTLKQLARAMEEKYDNDEASAFWRNATYDMLLDALAGDTPAQLEVLKKRYELCKSQYRKEVLAGRDRAAISCTKDLVNTLTNLASGTMHLPPPALPPREVVVALLDEAERYAEQRRPRDGGHLFATVLRQRAQVELMSDNDVKALQLLTKAIAIFETNDPRYKQTQNGFLDHWELSNMLIRNGKVVEGYDLKEEILTIGERVLGSDHPMMLKRRRELQEDLDRDQFGEALAFGRAFHNADDEDRTIATGFCYTGQRAKICGVAKDQGGYRGLLEEEDGSWGQSFIPFPAVCLDEGTKIEVLDKESKWYRKQGVVAGFKVEEDEPQNFDKLRHMVVIGKSTQPIALAPKFTVVVDE